ncbi:MAG TPA: DIP1984 family protein [Thermomicrobiales bacterium]|nr:DIP1984 family protein [Thermomicrobiales bacterium]
MKLAEALILRADNQRRIEQLKQRIVQNAITQEGSDPAEDPNALVQEMERTADDLATLIQQINATNSSATLDDGTTLSAALARRDVLKLKHAIYRDAAQAASQTGNRYMRSELRMTPQIDVATIQQRADDLAREHRELDTRIQETNWRTDLIE